MISMRFPNQQNFKKVFQMTLKLERYIRFFITKYIKVHFEVADAVVHIRESRFEHVLIGAH